MKEKHVMRRGAKRQVTGFVRCCVAFPCAVCGERIIVDDLYARVVVFHEVGFPSEDRVCLSCGKVDQALRVSVGGEVGDVRPNEK